MKLKDGQQERKNGSFLGFVILFIMSAAFICWPFGRADSGLRGYKARNKHAMFRFNDLPSTTSLEFSSCFDGLQCAKLKVPLDWTKQPQYEGKYVGVAIARLPAIVSVTDPRYGGAVLVNPGGPGGSGVMMVAGVGRVLQQIVDSPKPVDDTMMSADSFDSRSRYFDIIGFDPRGVNNTTPTVRCFPDDATTVAWQQRTQVQGYPVSNESFANSWIRQISLAESCSWSLGDDEDENFMGIGRFLSTPSVVKDMVQIIEALGEWRQNEAGRLAAKQISSVRDAVLERTRWNKTNERLQFWGFSYGTLLGSTFASMYPDKVQRMVLDGVIDAEDYYSGTWLSNLQDTDSIINSFLKQCHAAGPSKCALATTSTEKSRSTFFRTIEQIKESPIPVPADERLGPDVITVSDLLYIISDALYRPRGGFSTLARVIKDLSERDGQEVARKKQREVPASCRSPHCNKNPWSKSCYSTDFPELPASFLLLSAAIFCSDGADIRSWTRDDHWKKWQILKSQSTIFSGPWAEVNMPCSSWDLRPVWTFNYTKSTWTTTHPILWLSNTRDPVTPLRNAEKMAAQFPGSVVFGQDADGHATIAQPSSCVANGLQEYFQSGRLPTEGITCKPDRGPFDTEQVDLGNGSLKEARLFKAVELLSSSRWFGFLHGA